MDKLVTHLVHKLGLLLGRRILVARADKPVRDVVEDGRAEERRLLRDEADLRSHPAHVEVADVDAVCMISARLRERTDRG